MCIPDVEDPEFYCNGCGWAELAARMTRCPNCDGLVCIECRDSKGRCMFCAEYSLPPNITIGSYSKSDIKVDTLKYYGIGHHYYVTVKGPRRGKHQYRAATWEAAREFIRRCLSRYRKKYQVYFEESEARHWFYREGD